MKLKPGVDSGNVAPQIWFALGVAWGLRRMNGLPELVVTALRDGEHMKGSLHYEGRGADVRILDLTPEDRIGWFQTLKLRLDPLGFDVVLERDHLHIEYQPQPGEQFISQA
jgi:hypothetical protein